MLNNHEANDYVKLWNKVKDHIYMLFTCVIKGCCDSKDDLHERLRNCTGQSFTSSLQWCRFPSLPKHLTYHLSLETSVLVALHHSLTAMCILWREINKKALKVRKICSYQDLRFLVTFCALIRTQLV